MKNNISSERVKEIARRLCLNLGLDPDEKVSVQIDAVNAANMPRYATFTATVYGILLQREINKIIDYEGL